jgi:CcmD family protein
MPGTFAAAPYVVAAYALIWLGLLAYVGWIGLRLRGVRTELETVRELVEEHGSRTQLPLPMREGVEES